MQKSEFEHVNLQYTCPSRDAFSLDRGIYRELINGPATRQQLVKALQTPRTTIYDRLHLFMKLRWVKREPEDRRVRGRPQIYFSLTGIGLVKLQEITTIDYFKLKDRYHQP